MADVSQLFPSLPTPQGDILQQQLGAAQDISTKAQTDVTSASKAATAARADAFRSGGKTRAETASNIGRSVGTLLFGSKNIKDSDAKVEELQKAMALAEANVAKNKELIAADNQLKQLTLRNDAQMTDVLNAFDSNPNKQEALGQLQGQYNAIVTTPEFKQAMAAKGHNVIGGELTMDGGGNLLASIITDKGVSSPRAFELLLSDDGEGHRGRKKEAASLAGQQLANRNAAVNANVAEQTQEAQIAQAQTGADRAAVDLEIRQGLRPSPTQRTQELEPSAFTGAVAQAEEATVGSILEKGKIASERVNALAQAEAVIDTAATGSLGESRIFLANVASQVGLDSLIPDDVLKGIQDLDTLIDASKKGVVDRIVEGGRGFTDPDRKLVQEALINVTSTKGVARVGLILSQFADSNSLERQRIVSDRSLSDDQKRAALSDIDTSRSENVRNIMAVMSSPKAEGVPYDTLKNKFKEKGWLK